MATTNEDGFREIQLNGKQLVFLFMAVTVASVVIFLCGVLVGRGVRAERPAATVTAEQQAQPVPDAIPSVGAPTTGAPPTANEDLSYPNRLARSEPATEQLRPATPEAPPAAPPPTPPTPREDTRVIETPAPAAAPPPAREPAPAATAEPAGSGFAIQIAALRQRGEADSIARGLVAKGYSAYVIEPDSGAPAVFRVRVGKFKERREAESVAARLQKEEQFKPWIVR